MDTDREKWNRRFADKPLIPPRAPGFLEAAIGELAPGSALELACGDGAGALCLAAAGFEVTAVDISGVALARLRNFYGECTGGRAGGRAGGRVGEGANRIHTRALDLDNIEALNGLGRFNNLLVFNYKPAPALWQRLPDLLLPGGRLMLSTFNTEHHRKTGFPLRFCLSPRELIGSHPQLELLVYQSVVRGDDAMDDYLFIRR